MRFGANYTPRQDWFFSWLDLDLAETRRDFDTLKSLGLDHVRIFPLWPLLQPNRTHIRARALADVRDVVRVGADAGLNVVVDVFQGHLSSFDFLPSWVSSWHRRNLFTDPDVVEGQVALVRALGETLADESNLLGLSMGNEIIQFAAQRHPFTHQISSDEAGAWLTTMLDAARDALPEGMHTHSYDDDLFFDPTHPFTPDHAVTLGGLTTVHSWVFVTAGRVLGADHPGLATFARYLCELAEAWAPTSDRQVWLQEVGAPLTHLSPESAPQFLTQTMEQLHSFDPLWGITWWCSHDVSRSLADYPDLEYTLGLIDADGQVKPTGRAFADAIAAWPQTPPAPTEREIMTFADDDLAAARASTGADSPLFRAWMERALDGHPPALVRASQHDLG